MNNLNLRPQKVSKLPAGRIDPHPLNFRIHTEQQRRNLTAILQEIGFIGGIIVRKHGQDESGERYQCLDGHERLSRFAPDEDVTAVIVDMTDEEAAKFLATYDTITSLAETDVEALQRLTDGLDWQHDTDGLLASTIEGLLNPDRPAAQDNTLLAGEIPHVLITCTDEQHQRKLLKRFQKEGRKVRALNS